MNMNDLYLHYSYEELMEEFYYFIESPGRLSLKSPRNKIIKFFQQNIFYKEERKLWADKNIREKLIANRCNYLNKKPDELTNEDILRGFKITGIHYGYSMFNPLLAKWFFERYNINSCYDPCGGWGHRMLGASNLDMYIYNDISTAVCDNIQDMKDYFDLYNVKIYNEDASKFEPDDEFESIFTCPPYKDLERYSNEVDFECLMNNIYNLYTSRPTCKYLGIILREDMMFLSGYAEKIELKNDTSHLVKNKTHKNKEFLYIWIEN